ncbi:MAG TPA: hypothetical protein VMX97_13190, partial [Hyphomicrobiaceae bacterium]|nr:hypothetical protein [Hyphomicrobiaceae bacterium]
VVWAYSGGSVALEADFRSFTVSEEVNDADSTAGDDTYAGHLPTFTDASADMEMLGTTNSGTTHWSRLAPRTEGSVHWWKEGTTSTKPFHYAAAYIQARDRDYPFDDVATVSLTWQFDGAITDGEVA